jgi:hypothetical protein
MSDTSTIVMSLTVLYQYHLDASITVIYHALSDCIVLNSYNLPFISNNGVSCSTTKSLKIHEIESLCSL